jgi:hypothetical protein
MTPKEVVVARLGRAVRDRLCKSRIEVPAGTVFANVRLNEAYGRRFAESFPDALPIVVDQAEEVLNNRITLFGAKVPFGQAIDWNRDYVTGDRWPTRRVDYHGCLAGDPKVVWELNRHQFMPVLGKAAFLTGEERYAAKAVDLLLSWIEQNPPYVGINWVSGIELALRVMSWIWTLKYITNSAHLTPPAYVRIVGSLYLQVNHVARHLSLYSSANNHLISELSAMAVAGYALNHRRWVQRALTMLESEIDRQVLGDGVGAEQSVSYLSHTMEYYLLVLLEMKERDAAFPGKEMERLRRAAIFLQSLMDQTGMLPGFGDNDSGEVLALSSGCYGNYKSLVNLVGYLTGTAGLIQGDVALDEKTYWLVGPDSFEVLKKQPRAPKLRRSSFPDGGYYVLESRLRGKAVRVVFDCGPLGMRPGAGHGHSDALSFVLFVDECSILIDPGTYTYFGSNFWRDYFRGTSAHNTVRVDGKDQSEFAGKFLASYHAQAECVEWIEGCKVVGRQKGYNRLRDPLTHTRSLSIDGARDSLVIADEFEAAGAHLLETYFHFDSSCEVTAEDSNLFSVSARGRDMHRLSLFLDARMEWGAFFGDESMPLGWQSRGYGRIEKTQTIRGKAISKGRECFVTELRLL